MWCLHVFYIYILYIRWTQVLLVRQVWTTLFTPSEWTTLWLGSTKRALPTKIYLKTHHLQLLLTAEHITRAKAMLAPLRFSHQKQRLMHHWEPQGPHRLVFFSLCLHWYHNLRSMWQIVTAWRSVWWVESQMERGGRKRKMCERCSLRHKFIQKFRSDPRATSGSRLALQLGTSAKAASFLAFVFSCNYLQFYQKAWRTLSKFALWFLPSSNVSRIQVFSSFFSTSPSMKFNTKL